MKAKSAVSSVVASSAASQVLLAANPNRVGVTIFNNSTQILYIAFGPVATALAFTRKLAAAEFAVIDVGYTGAISGIWAAANGNAQISDLRDSYPAPTNDVAPTLTGDAEVGVMLEVNHGDWSANGGPTVLSRQWKRDGVAIAGMTGTGYTVQASDAGKAITCTVTGNCNGLTTAATTAAKNIPA